MITRCSKWILWVFLTALPFGCSQAFSPKDAMAPSIGTKTPTVTSMPALSKLPTSLPQRSPTSEPALTWTTIPSLSPQEATRVLLELYTDNGGCELPCWWGITPGTTTWKMAYSKLAPLGKVFDPMIRNPVLRYDFEFVAPPEIGPLEYIQPVVWVKDEVVIAISLNASWIKHDFDYSLAGLLRAFGQPEEIWIKVFPESMLVPHYNIDLFYPSKGMAIEATGTAQVHGNTLTICPRPFRLDSLPPGILLWGPEESITFQNHGRDLLGGLTSFSPAGYHRLPDLTQNFDEADFHTTYLDPNTTVCFDVDLNRLP